MARGEGLDATPQLQKGLKGAINYKDEAGLRPERGTVLHQEKPMDSHAEV